MEKLRDKINKKYGTEIISKGSSVISMPRIPTGSLSLDVETGGGIPIGRISTISGHYSDGKTAIVLKIVSEYQKAWPEKEVVWIDAEGAWDNKWASALGVLYDRVYIVHPEYSQQAFDIAEQCITNDVGLLVIDSIAALTPKEEAEATMEDWQIGLAARINNKFIRRTHSSLNDKRSSDVPPTVILINQLRDNVGYGQAETEPGGKGIGFAASIRIKIRKGELYPKPKSNYDQTIVPKAQQVKFFVEKNKTAPPHTRGHFWLYFDNYDEYRKKGDVDRLEEIIRYSQKYNVVKRRGSYFDLLNSDTGEVQSFQGATALANHIRTNPEAQKYIEEEVFRCIRSNHVTETEDILPNTSDKAEGEKGSKESTGEETGSIGSDTVGQGRHQNGEILDTTQVHWNEESFSLPGSTPDS